MLLPVIMFLIDEHYYWKQHSLLFHDDIHIHGCIYETSLRHWKSSCFICSLYGSYFGGGYSFTSWMKEKMADYYFNAYYILWEQHYRTWDPHLCHWSRFELSLEACMHLKNGNLLTWRYKRFHHFLVGNLLDVHSYYVVIYFYDIFYALVFFGRMHTRKWDPGTLFPNGVVWRAVLIVGVQ